MKCPYCQNENQPGARYCSSCGKKLPANDSVISPTAGKGKRLAARILSIASIPFGVLTGFFGLAMGIVGRALDKDRRFTSLSTLGIVFGAITLFVELAAIVALIVLAFLYGPKVVEGIVEAFSSLPSA